MLIWGLTQQEITQAAGRAGVRVAGGSGSDHGTPQKNGRAFCFTIKTNGPTTNGLPVVWGRRSQHIRNKDGQYRRVPGAVCWHGHREFMRCCFRINPKARIKSSIADYRGRVRFERDHRSSYGTYGHWGGRPFGESCDCGEGKDG